MNVMFYDCQIHLTTSIYLYPVRYQQFEQYFSKKCYIGFAGFSENWLRVYSYGYIRCRQSNSRLGLARVQNEYGRYDS